MSDDKIFSQVCELHDQLIAAGLVAELFILREFQLYQSRGGQLAQFTGFARIVENAFRISNGLIGILQGAPST
jgi:hypothetical protein